MPILGVKAQIKHRSIVPPRPRCATVPNVPDTLWIYCRASPFPFPSETGTWPSEGIHLVLLLPLQASSLPETSQLAAQEQGGDSTANRCTLSQAAPFGQDDEKSSCRTATTFLMHLRKEHFIVTKAGLFLFSSSRRLWGGLCGAELMTWLGSHHSIHHPPNRK